MTNLVDRARSPRGQQTRESLVDAGLSLLADGGWGAVTTRAVAARSGTNAGLIHYHFGGLPGLRAALAQRASEAAVGPLVDMVLRSSDLDEGIDAIRAGIERLAADDRLVRLAVQLVAGAGQDPALGAAFRDSLAGARAAIADWVGARRPDWTDERRTGFAALVAALIDGLLLHRALDDHAPMTEALTAFRDLTDAVAPPDPHRSPLAPRRKGTP
ncbi:TetR/AcrR family transcriptional regulator [Isoptericola sp. NPDC057391]|uniref:TetR/AcrR family transcriptional regulator n=1 Tax=Isoptericola sp. NPDC057391 TaxID=3346117 RepID=UPI0036437C62